MFLTRDELKALTGGKRPTSIRAWLDREGIRYATGIDGWPRVLRSVILSRLDPSAPAVNEPRLRLA